MNDLILIAERNLQLNKMCLIFYGFIDSTFKVKNIENGTNSFKTWMMHSMTLKFERKRKKRGFENGNP